MPSFTFYATAEAVVNAGARPVFCDVDPATRNVTADTVRAVLTPRTKAIVAVDLFGCPAPLPEIRELGLPVLEDAAQAAGASLDGRRAGALADVGHVLVLPLQEPRLLRRRRRDRDRRRPHRGAGARAALPRLARQADVRVRRLQLAPGRAPGGDPARAAPRARRLVGRAGAPAAEAYAEAGIGRYVTPPAVPAGAEPAWHLYVATHPRADELIAGLADHGVQSRAYYRTPLHRQPAMAPYAPAAGSLPATDELARTNLALPMSPALDPERAGEVVAALAAVLGD